MYNYDNLKDIKLEDTGLIKNNCKDCVYNRLTKNGITNLKDLFNLFDLDLIDYGKTNSILDKCKYFQTIGIISLLRTKYLKEDLLFTKILESNLFRGKLILEDNSKERTEFVYEFLKLGLTFDFIVNLRQKIIKLENVQVIDLLESVYLNKITLDNDKELEKNKKRIKIILDWYYEKKKTQINNLNVKKLINI